MTFVLLPLAAVAVGLTLLLIWQAATSFVGFAAMISWAVANSSMAMDRERRVSKRILKRVEEAKRALPEQRIDNR